MERADERLRAGLYSDSLAVFLRLKNELGVSTPPVMLGIAVSIIQGELHGYHAHDQHEYDGMYYSDLTLSLAESVRAMPRERVMSDPDLLLALGVAHQVNLDDEGAIAAYTELLLSEEPEFDRREIQAAATALALPRQGCPGLDATEAKVLIARARKSRNRHCGLALYRQALRLERDNLEAMEGLASELRATYPDNTIICLQVSKLLNKTLTGQKRDSPEVRLHFADSLHCVGRRAEACREYAFALQQSPRELTAEKLRLRMAVCEPN